MKIGDDRDVFHSATRKYILYLRFDIATSSSTSGANTLSPGAVFPRARNPWIFRNAFLYVHTPHQLTLYTFQMYCASQQQVNTRHSFYYTHGVVQGSFQMTILNFA